MTSNKKPQLLITVGWFLDGAGQSRVVAEEVAHLANHYDITVLADLVSWSPPIEARLVNLSKCGGPIRSLRTLRAEIRRSDLVHCHDSLKMMTVTALSGVPWIVTSHGIAPLRLRTGLRSRANAVVAGVAYPMLYRRASQFVAISPFIADWAAGRVGRRPVLIENGAWHVSADAGTPPARRSMLYVGEQSRRKGVDELLQGVAALESDVHLFMAGIGTIPEAWKPRSGATVHYLGVVPDDELVRLLGSVTCVVSASHWEGYGLPVVEGFTHGRPALVRNTTNLGRLIDAAGAGRSFSDAQEIKGLFLDIERRWQEYNALATDYAERHSWSLVFEAYAELFTLVLNQQARQPAAPAAWT